MDEKLIENIVEKIIEDLSERKCLRCEWEHFDDDVKKEIRERYLDVFMSEMKEKSKYLDAPR